MILLIINLISIFASIAVSPVTSDRFLLGANLVNNPANGVVIESGNSSEYLKFDESTGTMIDKVVTIGFMPGKYRGMTAATLPTGANDGTRGCVETVFLSVDDIKAEHKIPQKNGIVLLADDKLDALEVALDAHLRQIIHDKRVTLGFLRNFKPLDDDTRKVLIDAKIPFIENIELPIGIDLLSAVRSSRRFYGFKKVLPLFDNKTSVHRDEEFEHEQAQINFADLVLFESDPIWDKYCKEMGENVTLFSHDLSSTVGIPMLPDAEEPHFVQINTNEHWLSYSGSVGTHVVAPYRFDQSKSSIDKLDPRFSFSLCTIVEMPFSDVVNFKVTKGHLEQWEKDRGQQITPESLVLINTGFYSKWKNAQTYEEQFPSLDLGAAKWLVEERRVVAIGMDTLSLDDANLMKQNNSWATHSYLADRNLPVLLNVNFEESDRHNCPNFGSRCLVAYQKIEGGTSAAAEIFGLPDFENPEFKQAVAAVVPKVSPGPAPISLVSKDRWHLSPIIRNKALDCNCDITPVTLDVYKRIDATTKLPIVGHEITLSVDPTKNFVATLTQANNLAVNTTEGCIEVLFVKNADIKVVKNKLNNIRENMLLIFINPDMITLNDAEMIKVISQRKVSLGFFGEDTLPGDVRNQLIGNNIVLLENLVMPGNSEEFVNQIVEDRVYYGFRFVFSPFSIETSLPASIDEMVPSRKINLVDLVVYDSSIEAIRYRCGKKAYAILSQKWGPAEQIPIFKGFRRPELVDDPIWGKKMRFSDHYSTHVDFPRVFDTASPFDATKLTPALEHPVCFRVNIPFNERPNFSISKADLINWEKEHNAEIVANSLVLLDTGYAMAKWAIPDKYVIDYPGLSFEAAKWLVEERHVAAIGIDSLTMDDYSLTNLLKFPTSAYLASKQIPTILNLGGQLSKFPSSDGICTMAFLRVENGTGAPVSLFGLLPDTAHSLTTPTPALSEAPATPCLTDSVIVAIVVAVVLLLN